MRNQATDQTFSSYYWTNNVSGINSSWKQTVLTTKTGSDLYLGHQGSEKEDEAKKNYILYIKNYHF